MKLAKRVNGRNSTPSIWRSSHWSMLNLLDLHASPHPPPVLAAQRLCHHPPRLPKNHYHLPQQILPSPLTTLPPLLTSQSMISIKPRILWRRAPRIHADNKLFFFLHLHVFYKTMCKAPPFTTHKVKHCVMMIQPGVGTGIENIRTATVIETATETGI